MGRQAEHDISAMSGLAEITGRQIIEIFDALTRAQRIEFAEYFFKIMREALKRSAQIKILEHLCFTERRQ